MAEAKLSRTVTYLLQALQRMGDQWARPMDVGGYSGSYHSSLLRLLCDKGLVERRPRGTLMNCLGGRPVSWEYKITAAGAQALADVQKEDVSDG